MKTIGLFGGMSWPSTIEYYRILNELAQEKLGGFHSAKILLYSIDYHEIKSRYHSGWHEIPHLDAVVLACTEIPLVVKQNDFDIEIVNPSELQCRRAFEFAVTDI
jgi:aspartate/glutamate racemase